MKKRAYQKDEVFGHLTVIAEAPPQCGKARVTLKCVCGKVVERFLSNLYVPTEFTRSCGCNRKESFKKKKAKKHRAFSSLSQAFYLGRPLCLDE